MAITKPTKIHLGLISADRKYDEDVKQALAELGGGYVHAAKSLLEMNQKLTMQKVQLIVYVAGENETGQEALALVQFFRAKRDLQQTPICILSPNDQVVFKTLITDPRVRYFSTSTGFFVPLMTMLPLITATDHDQLVAPLTSNWLQSELESSIKEKLGQGLSFEMTTASDDDLRQSFLAQSSAEVRSHLGWFKFTVRILNEDQNSLQKVFGTGSTEELENMGEALLSHIQLDFNEKVSKELQSRGALFYQEMDKLSPADRKILLSKSKASGFKLHSENISFTLESSQYL